mgnify:CR=1 FL=1
MGSDIFPISQAEILIGILLVVIGIIIIGYRVGELSNLILQMNQKERETLEEFENIQALFIQL